MMTNSVSQKPNLGFDIKSLTKSQSGFTYLVVVCAHSCVQVGRRHTGVLCDARGQCP